MKLDLPAATLMRAIPALVLSAIVGANAMAAASTTNNAAPVHPVTLPYKLQCAGFGAKEVIFQNVGHGPVPAGTAVLWQLPKEIHQIGGSDVTFPAQSGIYTFQNPLAPEGQVAINVPTPAPDQGGNGGNPPPELVGLTLAFLRSCTLSPAPTNYRMMPH
jgi:hypothetical protein